MGEWQRKMERESKGKFQNPNSKIQIPNSKQIPRTQIPKGDGDESAALGF
jgi:hypothetical protein